MKFTEFRIKNFKGIEDITFNLEKSPEANIYTMVGLNESGKTTILEAINHFNTVDEGLGALDIPGATIKDFNSLIPISRRDNFNDTIFLEVTLKLEQHDLEAINGFTHASTVFKEIQPITHIKYSKYYHFKNSKFEKLESTWDGFSGRLKNQSGKKYVDISNEFYKKENYALYFFCQTLLPSILYFPSFLFDFPSKILLETKAIASAKEIFYQELVQDILNSLKNGTNIKTHLIDRIKSEDKSEKRSLDRLIQLMEKKLSDVIFEAWNRIFKRRLKDARIKIDYDVDADQLVFLELQIEAEDGIYQINERSLGFKWFFIFLLFTQFRPFRKNKSRNVIFLFDEPAANLHSSAQKQLLKSFENLIDNSKVIYTTHSHHLINPHWLESTYVVKNEGLNLDDPDSFNIKKTNISIQPYRDFASKHPHQTAYFQPILAVLDYVPSNLETTPNCVFLEGKNDFYTITYFKNIILDSKCELNLMPCTSSSSLDTLISLYIGWGKKFIILLDSDEEGENQKKRYQEKFGILVENVVFTLKDIDNKWQKKELEDLISQTELLKFQQTAYPSTTSYNKTQFNRAIQENLINKKKFKFLDETVENFKTILHFLHTKVNL